MGSPDGTKLSVSTAAADPALTGIKADAGAVFKLNATGKETVLPQLSKRQTVPARTPVEELRLGPFGLLVDNSNAVGLYVFYAASLCFAA